MRRRRLSEVIKNRRIEVYGTGLNSEEENIWIFGCCYHRGIGCGTHSLDNVLLKDLYKLVPGVQFNQLEVFNKKHVFRPLISVSQYQSISDGEVSQPESVVYRVSTTAAKLYLLIKVCLFALADKTSHLGRYSAAF